ncbi:Lysine exporter protein (LYSE/YGGA) [Desulfovibrio sp. X2]|uniref:LysE family translocator n=1 Tax=Desulfovibrio sp. X2 TaxID=941449 RepID=UPI000358A76E|nr:LysE family translocator [Desulfovibrio sp. X2]EPR43528.1 Lysine exporter protein (LYSE/YGGA) [Desulfovibrio sp. X2]
MSLDLYLAFVLATIVVLVLPGPTVMYVVGRSLSHGRASVLFTAPGVALGDFLSMSCALLGMGALLAASAALFTALKLCGAAYLVWLGVKTWRAAPTGEAAGVARTEDTSRFFGPLKKCRMQGARKIQSRRVSLHTRGGESFAATQQTALFQRPEVPGGMLFGQAFVITALNPKSIAFFVAFLPQFVRHDLPLGPQFAVLVPTFVVLATANAALYGLLAGSVRERARDPRVLRVVNRIGGGALIGAGLMTAALRRTAS